MTFQQWLHIGTIIAIALGVCVLVWLAGQGLVSFFRFIISLFRVRSLVERVEVLESQMQYPVMYQTALSRLILDNNKTIERLDMNVKALLQQPKKKAKS